MYKIYTIILLIAISSAARSQEKHFTPKPLQIPGIGESTVLPGITLPPNKIDIDKARAFVRSNSVIAPLAPDNMPCVVPNQANIAAIPNGFSPHKSLPYMPNSMPLSKKSVPR